MSAGRIYVFLWRRWWLAFLLLGVSFVLFGYLSLNLLHLLGANLEYLGMYGFEAVREGGARQLVGIVVSGYFAAACYIVFKVCERVLVDRAAAAWKADA
jgi:hypothetical protein